MAGLVADLASWRARDARGALYVVTPSRLLGRSIARQAARVRGGVANLHCVTLPDLAERVAGLSLALAGRRPLPPVADWLVVTRAIRQAVPATGGYFSRVAGRPNFPAAMLRTLADLKRAGLTPAALAEATGGHEKLGELAACYRATEAALDEHGFYDASTLLIEATARLAADPTCLGAAAILVVGFTELNPLERRLVEACRRAAPLREYPAEAAAAPPPARIQIVAAPGEEREVREIARIIQAHAAAGGRFEEVGILLHQPALYRAAIRDVFGAAGIAYSWGVPPPLSESRSGRSLVLLLEARRADFARAAVMEFLAFADLRPGSGVSPAEWERLAREAGIVGGARAWRDRLDRLTRLREPFPSVPDDEEGHADRVRDRDALLALRQTAGRLVSGLRRLLPEASVAALARRLGATFRRLVQPSPEADQVLGALVGLGALAPLEARVSLDEFRALLDDALAAPAAAESDAREGTVHVGELTASAGPAFPITIVPGLVEGGFPAPIREDPILLDEERRRWPELPLAADRRERDRVAFRLAVGSGATSLVLTYPRVDAASGRPRVPSFFLLDLLEEVTGRRHDFTALARAPQHRRVALHPVHDLAMRQPIDEREWLVGRALAARAQPAAFLVALPRAARGLAAIAGRERTPRLTPYDGLLARGVEPDEALAPTWLEIYATCPFKYFLGHVLGLASVQEPDAVLLISPADRGTLVHAALCGAFRRLREAGALPLSADRLPAATAALDAAFDEACAVAERRGVTGLPALWAGERARIAAGLRGALEAEARAGGEWTAVELEVAFGLPWVPDSTPPVPYTLPDGTTLRFRGQVDRIDRSPDGRRVRVIDYKTGRARGTAPDRLARGTALQLPIYRLAAEALLAARDDPATVEEAQYYHPLGPSAGRRVAFTRAGWERRRADFDRAVALVVEGIREGRFFARPAACAARLPCAFDLACGAECRRWSEAKLADPAVQRHAELEAIE
jgi:ATP-dependent helicase/DNAse subunit B